MEGVKVRGCNEGTHPFLLGPRLYLRGLERLDLSGRYFQWLNDQEADTYTDHAMWPNSPEAMEEFYRRVTQGRRDLILAIVVREGDLHIGNIGLHKISWIHRNAEYAILIGERGYWDRGLATEATRLILAYGFNKLNLHRVALGVNAEHKAALRAYAKVGFVEEGRFRQCFLRGGRFVDVIRMSILRDEFVAKYPHLGRLYGLPDAVVDESMLFEELTA